MIVFGADEQRVERLTTFVSLVLALILQLSAGLLLVGMCREEVLTRQPPVPLITVTLAPEPAPAGPAKTAVSAPVEETEKVSQVPEISQPAPHEPEVAQPPETVPIEPPKKLIISKKAERKPEKSSKKPVKKTVEKSAAEPLEKPAAQPETAKPDQQPESAIPALNAAAQTNRNAGSRTEKPVEALSGKEQKAIARYLAQVRRSLDRSRVYPPEARKKRIEGVVPVKFRISADGQVVGAEVTGNAPDVLAEAVIKMLAGRRFPPPPTGWQPSAAIELNINFNLR